MTWIGPLLLGFAVGLISSVPPAGPGALLQIRRGLQGRFAAGMAVATGGSLADATYCLLAVLGMGYLLSSFPVLVEGVRWLGLVVLVGVGGYFIFRPPRAEGGEDDDPREAGVLARELFVGLTLTGTNPTLLVTWTTAVAVIASLGWIELSGWGRFTFPVGVAAGNVAWSAILLGLLTRYGDRFSERLIRWIMRVIGAALLVVAAVHGYNLATDRGPLEDAASRPASRAAGA